LTTQRAVRRDGRGSTSCAGCSTGSSGWHRAVVFREAAQVAAADGVHADELALIKTIVELLR